MQAVDVLQARDWNAGLDKILLQSFTSRKGMMAVAQCCTLDVVIFSQNINFYILLCGFLLVKDPEFFLH